MTIGVLSSSATGTLTVSDSILKNDIVLKLVIGLLSNKQLKVVKVAKGSELKLGLSQNGSIELTQRGSIIRSLAGPALHYVLDDVLLGGHGAASKNSASTKSCLALSSLQSWMTVAERLTAGKTSIEVVLPQLDSYLETKSFLIPSPRSTLADMEMCSVLLRVKKDKKFPRNVQRWLNTVRAQMALLGATQLPPLKSDSNTMPSFFYGTEDAEPTPKSPELDVGDTTDKPCNKTDKPCDKTDKPCDKTDNPSNNITEEQKKAAAEKRAKKQAAKAAKGKKKNENAPAAAELNIMALDIRVGKILSAWHHEDTEKLFCEEIDVGEEKPRKIASGLRAFYETEDLVNRHVLVVCNLKARPMAGFPSYGMVLCASNDDHTKVEFVVPPPNAPIGERVVFGNLEGNPEPENKVGKKKMLEKLIPDLKTNEDGVVEWKKHQAKTTTGEVKAVNGMANASVG